MILDMPRARWLWKAAWGQQTCPSKSGFLPSLRINPVSRLSSWSVVSSRHSWVFWAFFWGECFMSGLHAKHPSRHTQAVFVLGDCSCSLCLPWAASNKYFLCGWMRARLCWVVFVHSGLKLAFPPHEAGASVHLLHCIPTSVTWQRVGCRALSKISKHFLEQLLRGGKSCLK